MRSQIQWQLGLQGVLLACGLLCGLATCEAQSNRTATPYRPAEVWYAGERVAGPPQDADKPSAGVEENKSLAKRMLNEARVLAQRGDLDGAQRLCRWAMNLNAEWSADESSPAVVWQQLTLLAQQPRELPAERPREAATRPRAGDHPRTTRLPWTEDPALPPGWRPWNPLQDTATRAGVAPWPERGPLESPQRSPDPRGGEPSLPIPDTNSSNTNSGDGAPDGGKEHVKAAKAAAAIAVATPRFDPGRQFAARPAAAPTLASQAFASFGPLIGFLLGIVVCLALLVVALVALRRLSAGGGAVFRVELVNAAGPPIGFATGNAPTAADDEGEQELIVPRRRDFDDTPKGVVVDWSAPSDLPIPLEALGPSWDDQQKEEAELKKQKEQAILQHILTTNVALQEQLVGGGPAAKAS